MSENSATMVLDSPAKTHGADSSIESRAVELLGAGVTVEQAAAALGVTPGRISQLMSEEKFASKVTQLKFTNLQKHNIRDSEYDTLEDKVLAKLKLSVESGMVYRPLELNRILATLNAAKRRGISEPAAITNQSTVISLTLPVTIVQQFKRDSSNRVIEAGNQTLVTIPSSMLQKKLADQIANSEAQIITENLNEQSHGKEIVRQLTNNPTNSS